MKTQPEGVYTFRPPLGLVPINEWVWPYFSMKEQAKDCLKIFLESFPSTKDVVIYDQDPANANVVRTGDPKGDPRMWGIKGVIQMDNGKQIYFDNSCGDLMDRRDSPKFQDVKNGTKFGVLIFKNLISGDFSELQDMWGSTSPLINGQGDLHWV